jgi:hypothetical protein
MIFDCERLKRLLEEEKRYFKELSSTEEKSHVERLAELESIRKKLIEEEVISSGMEKNVKIRLGFLRLYNIFR